MDTFEQHKIDPVLVAYRDGIEALGLPTTAWPGPGTQHIALKDIVERTKTLAESSAIPDPCDFARAILVVFSRLRDEGRGWWKNASPAPRVLLQRFDELVVGLASAHTADSRIDRLIEADG